MSSTTVHTKEKHQKLKISTVCSDTTMGWNTGLLAECRQGLHYRQAVEEVEQGSQKNE